MLSARKVKLTLLPPSCHHSSAAVQTNLGQSILLRWSFSCKRSCKPLRSTPESCSSDSGEAWDHLNFCIRCQCLAGIASSRCRRENFAAVAQLTLFWSLCGFAQRDTIQQEAQKFVLMSDRSWLNLNVADNICRDSAALIRCSFGSCFRSVNSYSSSCAMAKIFRRAVWLERWYGCRAEKTVLDGLSGYTKALLATWACRYL